MQNLMKFPLYENPNVILRAVPGHFVTPNAHVNYYLDMTTIKSRSNEAFAAAKELSKKVSPTSTVDTIVCMDGCDIIGAYLATELTQAGIISVNYHKSIYVITPEESHSGQLLFRDNIQPMIKDKNVLLVVATAATGKTIGRAVEALKYYGATINEICAVFSAVNSYCGLPVRSLFTTKDIPHYKLYSQEGCTLCKNREPINAFANAYGYSHL